MVYKDGEINLDSFIQKRTLDKTGLAAILLQAKGLHRTMIQFSEECGVSASTFSRILNQKITKPLSKELIVNIAKHAACEDEHENRDYILLQLLHANGFVDSEFFEEKIHLTEQTIERDEKLFSLENEIKNILSMGLLKRKIGIKYHDYIQADKINSLLLGLLRNELVIELTELFPRYCCFILLTTLHDESLDPLGERNIYRTYEMEAKHFLRDTAIYYLENIWNPESFFNIRTIFVFNDEVIYKEYQKLILSREVNSDFSIILVDIEKKDVIKEWHMKNNGECKYLFCSPIEKT